MLVPKLEGGVQTEAGAKKAGGNRRLLLAHWLDSVVSVAHRGLKYRGSAGNYGSSQM